MSKRSLDFSGLNREYLKYLKSKETKSHPIIDKIGKLKTFYLPLSKWIYSIYKKNQKIKIIGLSGGQGAGKSTITAVLKFLLKKLYGLEVCIISIDDFYKTKNERKKMSKKIHPLFLTRGVPGTHDINLINRIFQKLKKKNFKPFLIPKFDKSIDDRFKKKKWTRINKSPNIIIFEGWCVGAEHQKINALKKSINELERKYDASLIWRKTVNEYLKKYKKIFKKIDKLVYLKVPNFNQIYYWRLLQEKKLKLTSKNKEIMSKSQIKDFIMHYERITKQMMKEHLKISNLVVYLDKDHRSRRIKFIN